MSLRSAKRKMRYDRFEKMVTRGAWYDVLFTVLAIIAIIAFMVNMFTTL
ncbi:MAG: hypothetical protein LBT37_05075 [Lactobacillaceae bacterium]|nr:hypothetical protein [Lactobacillaceae bacterium]